MIKFIEDKELCIKLKEKGFDEGCILQFRGEDTQPVCQMGYELNYEKNSDFNNEDNYWLACPTYCQVSDWLREKHNILISILFNQNDCCYEYQGLSIISKSPYFVGSKFNNYYDALTEAINEALKLI